jgi:regulator of nonsense transcripts 1
MDPYSRNHDSISYISPERAQAAMNMTHVPPRFYQQHQQSMQGTLSIKFNILSADF